MNLSPGVFEAKELRRIPVLILSADHFAGRSGQLLRAGAVACLTKPVTPETLKEHLVAILENCP
jgi:CheY-like chemotaxis protein